jgi:hypothetical protein
VTDAPLFANGDVNDYLQARLRGAVKAASQVAIEEVRFSAQAVVDRLVDEYGVVPVEFDFEAMTRTPVTEAQIRPTRSRSYVSQHQPGQTLSLIVPFTGDPELMRRKANTFRMGADPEGTVRADALVFSVSGRQLTKEIVDGQIAAMRKELTDRVGWANHDVEAWHPQLRDAVTSAINGRKQILDHAANLSAELDIPVTPVSGPKQIQVPVQRKRVRIEQAPPSPGNDDPRLADDVYEDVIRTISGMSRAVERLPGTARHLGEDGFRDILLFMLNANYEGAARGEVFNCTGKTDILLGWRDRNVFIGECKMWNGSAKFTDAIDQLLGYATWRDSKAALILFIKEQNPSKAIEKAAAAIQGHSSFRAATPSREPDVRRSYLMTSSQDSERFINLAFLPVIVTMS